MTDTNTPTSATEWKGRKAAGTHPLPLPSGNTALCRRPGIDTFMKMGLIPNSLMSIIQSSIQKAQLGRAPTPEEMAKEMAKLAEDTTKLGDVDYLADKVLCFVCVQPKIELPPDNDADRDESILYADEVDMEDKMYVFQWAVGGTESLESFREESGQGVGSALDSENVVDAT